MPFIKLPGLGTVHIRMAKRRRHACCDASCRQDAHYQCDYKLTHRRTCDEWICATHAVEVGPDLHHCPAHAHVQVGLFASKG